MIYKTIALRRVWYVLPTYRLQLKLETSLAHTVKFILNLTQFESLLIISKSPTSTKSSDLCKEWLNLTVPI